MKGVKEQLSAPDSVFQREYNSSPANPIPTNVKANTDLVKPMQYLTQAGQNAWGGKEGALKFQDWNSAVLGLNDALAAYGQANGYNIPVDMGVLYNVGSWGAQTGTGTDIRTGSVANQSAMFAQNIGEGYQGNPTSYNTPLLQMKVVQLPGGGFGIVKEEMTQEGEQANQWANNAPVVEYGNQTLNTGQYQWAQEEQARKAKMREEKYAPLMDPTKYKAPQAQKLTEQLQYSPYFSYKDSENIGEGSILTNMIRNALRDRYPQFFGGLGPENPNLDFMKRYAIYRMIEDQVARQRGITNYWNSLSRAEGSGQGQEGIGTGNMGAVGTTGGPSGSVGESDGTGTGW